MEKVKVFYAKNLIIGIYKLLFAGQDSDRVREKRNGDETRVANKIFAGAHFSFFLLT